MSEQKHTPEPWRYAGGAIVANSRVGTVYDPYVFAGYVVAATIYTSANGCRIVECVNACKGINPEAVPDLLEALERIADCEIPPGIRVFSGTPNDWKAVRGHHKKIAADAIAKAKGGAA